MGLMSVADTLRRLAVPTLRHRQAAAAKTHPLRRHRATTSMAAGLIRLPTPTATVLQEALPTHLLQLLRAAFPHRRVVLRLRGRTRAIPRRRSLPATHRLPQPRGRLRTRPHHPQLRAAHLTDPIRRTIRHQRRQDTGHRRRHPARLVRTIRACLLVQLPQRADLELLRQREDPHRAGRRRLLRPRRRPRRRLHRRQRRLSRLPPRAATTATAAACPYLRRSDPETRRRHLKSRRDPVRRRGRRPRNLMTAAQGRRRPQLDRPNRAHLVPLTKVTLLGHPGNTLRLRAATPRLREATLLILDRDTTTRHTDNSRFPAVTRDTRPLRLATLDTSTVRLHLAAATPIKDIHRSKEALLRQAARRRHKDTASTGPRHPLARVKWVPRRPIPELTLVITPRRRPQERVRHRLRHRRHHHPNRSSNRSRQPNATGVKSVHIKHISEDSEARES